MIGGRLVIPGTITNTSLPAVTENADYDAIANLPGLVHFVDWVAAKRLSTSPLACAEHVADVAYTRRSTYGGNPSFSTIGSGDAVSFIANSEVTSGVNINYAADFSLAFVVERDASSTGILTICAFSPGSEQAQFYANTGTNLLTLFSGTKTWTGALTGTLAPGEKKVIVIAYKHSTLTATVYLDGDSIGTCVVNSALAAGLLYVGRTTLQKIGHLFVFNTNLADSTASATLSYVTAYLAAEHGITL